MSFDDFKKEVAAVVKDYLPDEYKDAKVTIATVSKIGMTYDSLTVRPEGQLASPAANLNAFYEEYENGKAFDAIMDDISDVLQTKAPAHMQNLSWLLDFDKAKDHLFIRVSNAEKNEGLIASAPYKKVEDLIITYHVAVESTDHGLASTIINNDLLNHYGVSIEQVHEAAIENTPNLLGVKFKPMIEIVAENMGIGVDDLPVPSPSDPPLYVLSNNYLNFGAGLIMIPEVMDKVAEKLGNNLVILPSSVHEVIVTPVLPDTDISRLDDMVADINSNVVDPKEVLADHIYIYDGLEHSLTSSLTIQEQLNVMSDPDVDIDSDIDLNP